MKSRDVYDRLRLARRHLFTLVALLGCIAPWVTPRHFPVHPAQGAGDPTYLPGYGLQVEVIEQEFERMSPQREIAVRQLGRQLAGQAAPTADSSAPSARR